MPSIAELRAETQPDWLLARPGAEHWAGRLYMRRLSPYLTRLVLRTPLPANGVTAVMIPAGLLGALSFTFAGIWPAAVGVLLVQLQLLLDCSDGEVARWRRQFSPVGVYLDQLAHYSTEAAIPAAIGVRADGGWGSIGGWTGLAEWRAPELTAPKDRDFALLLGPFVETELADDFDWEAARALAEVNTRLRPGDLLGGPVLALYEDVPSGPRARAAV